MKFYCSSEMRNSPKCVACYFCQRTSCVQIPHCFTRAHARQMFHPAQVQKQQIRRALYFFSRFFYVPTTVPLLSLTFSQSLDPQSASFFVSCIHVERTRSTALHATSESLQYIPMIFAHPFQIDRRKQLTTATSAPPFRGTQIRCMLALHARTA